MLLGSSFDRLRVGQGVGRVGVARSGRRQHLVAGPGHGRHRLPRGPVTLESGDECRVDHPVLEGPDQDGRDEPAVLPVVADVGVRGPHEEDVTGYSGHLVLGPLTAEHEGVDLGLPRPEPGAGPRAHRAALDPVGAVGRTTVLFDLPGPVDAVTVVVVQDVVGADHDARRASGAEAGRHDFSVQMGPVQLLGGHGDPQ